MNSAVLPRSAVILAGGLGTRLRPALVAQPKVMAPVAGRPFLDYLIAYLSHQDIRRVMLALGYLAEQVIDFIKNGQTWNLEVDYAVETQQLGTGGALRNAFARMKTIGWIPSVEAGGDRAEEHETFFVLNGDTLFQIDLRKLWEYHQNCCLEDPSDKTKSLQATIALRKIDGEQEEMRERGCIKMGDDGRIISFDEKPGEVTGVESAIRLSSNASAQLWTNGGIYLVAPGALQEIEPGEAISLERQIFPRLVQKGRLAGCSLSGYFVDIGTPSSLAAFEQDVICGVVSTPSLSPD